LIDRVRISKTDLTTKKLKIVKKTEKLQADFEEGEQEAHRLRQKLHAKKKALAALQKQKDNLENELSENRGGLQNMEDYQTLTKKQTESGSDSFSETSISTV
jgi:peptidoglycan hydrolase CwlO-like protein